jgi:hypothetical protein
VDLSDDRGSFANRGRHALRGPGADVADREDTRPTCLKLKWRSPNIEGGVELFTGRHEPSLVDIDATREPTGIGIGADKKKNLPQPMFDARSAIYVPERRTEHASKLSLKSGEFISDVVYDVGQGGDPLHEVSGHRFGKFSSGDEVKSFDARRKKNDGLARRISTADKGHLFASASLPFNRGNPVRHAISFEILKRVHVGSTVPSAARDDHGPRSDLDPVCESQNMQHTRLVAV